MRQKTLLNEIKTLFERRLRKLSLLQEEQQDIPRLRGYIHQSIQQLQKIKVGADEGCWKPLFKLAINNEDVHVSRLILLHFLPSAETLNMSDDCYQILKDSGTLLHLASVSSSWLFDELLEASSNPFLKRLLTKHTNLQGGAVSELHYAVQYQSVKSVRHLLRCAQKVFSNHALQEYVLLKTPLKAQSVLHIASNYSSELFELFHQYGSLMLSSKEMNEWMQQPTVYNIQDEHVLSHFSMMPGKNAFLGLYLNLLDKDKYQVNDIIVETKKCEEALKLLPKLAYCLE